MYRDPKILALHLEDLGGLVDYSRATRSALIMVAFSHLARPVETATLLGPIVDFLRFARVPVLEVAP